MLFYMILIMLLLISIMFYQWGRYLLYLGVFIIDLVKYLVMVIMRFMVKSTFD